MSFLAPLLLVALAGLAVPVFLHLTERERKQVVQFPSLMFLRKIPYRSVRRRRIQHWSLLALRLLALAAIVMAFARPFLGSATLASAADGGARELVVLLDRSASMGYGDHDTRAKQAARDAVSSLSADDRASLVLFSTEAVVDVRSSPDRGAWNAAVDRSRVSAGGTRFGPALRAAQTILAESKLPQREVVIISDFQKLGWDRTETLHLPERTRVTPVIIATPEPSNVSVTSVSFERSTFAGQERVVATAALVNRGLLAATNITVALEIDGRAVQQQQATIEGGTSTAVSFAPVTLARALTRGSVVLTADKLPADDRLNFVLRPATPVPVALVEGGTGTGNRTSYLQQALGIGRAPAFAVDRRAPTAFTQGASAPAVVIFNDVAIDAGMLGDLERFVNGGGGVLIVAGERGRWPSAPALLPGELGPPVDRVSSRGAILGGLEYGHPIFDVFAAPRSGDFTLARFFRYRGLTAGEGATVLARFDDGSPALVERRVGTGRVVVWTSTLDTLWSDLPLQPVFLPFIHRAMAYLAQYREPAAWATVGQLARSEDFTRQAGGNRAGSADGTVRVLSPSGATVEVAATTTAGSAVVALDEPGFYEMLTGPNRDPNAPTVAVNMDPAESDLTAFEPSELVTMVTAAPDAAQNAAASASTLSLEERERRQGLWWYLLLLGLGLLGIESLVSNRIAARQTSAS